MDNFWNGLEWDLYIGDSGGNNVEEARGRSPWNKTWRPPIPGVTGTDSNPIWIRKTKTVLR